MTNTATSCIKAAPSRVVVRYQKKLCGTTMWKGYKKIINRIYLPLTFYQPGRETAEMSRIILTDVVVKVLNEKFLTSLKACFPKLNIEVVRKI